jgi:hypothetical protein
VADADLPARLLRLLRDPLLEVPEQVGLELADVLGERGELGLQEPRDVLVVVGLPGPAPARRRSRDAAADLR